jgi:Cys-tRNA(Pro)/Cys-tRNA(Cys) deacylase
MATPAILVARLAGIEHRVHTYEHDSSHGSYGEEAAALLGVEPARVFKTLVVTVDGALVVAVVPVDRQLDLKQLAQARGGKRAAMADAHGAERATGYVLGGISPLGQRKLLPTVIDASVLRFDTIFVSAGRRGLDIELAPEDLIRATGAMTADVAR